MRAGIALGSNIEPRLEHLQTACRQLLQLHEDTGRVLGSKVYETAPVDCPPGSAAFLNAVVEIETSLPPVALLGRLQAIEQGMGRPREHPKNSPRAIDLDVLYCGDLPYSDAELEIPHPRLAQRRFVLQPLADVRPDLLLPNFTRTVGQLLTETPPDDSITIYKNSIS